MALHTVGVAYGLANHVRLLNYQQITAAMTWTYLGQITILNAIGFGKLAIIAFLLWIQERTNRKKKWFLYILGVSGCIINLVSAIYILAHCRRLWRPSTKANPARCSGTAGMIKFGYITGSMCLIDHGNPSTRRSAKYL
jgi:hypothetical protein